MRKGVEAMLPDPKGPLSNNHYQIKFHQQTKNKYGHFTFPLKSQHCIKLLKTAVATL